MPQDQIHSTWATSDRFVPRTFVRPIRMFMQVEASSGLMLLAAAAVALVWANSPWAGAYHTFFEETRIELSILGIHLDETLAHIVNDGLMAIFFFVVGLEIKREVVVGELHDPRRAAVPVVAALGGMITPALIYLLIAGGLGAEAARGWGIPMATDIAFVVGVAALLGPRVPAGAKIFILTLAIADDIGAIAVIAVFYTSELSLGWLAAAGLGLLAVIAAQRVGIRSLSLYVPLAIAIWYATLESGVHATLAGVALGFATPARARYSSEEFRGKAEAIVAQVPVGADTMDEERSDHQSLLMSEVARESLSPLVRLERRLLPWSSFVIVPLFALANAGVTFSDIDTAGLPIGRVAIAVAVALVLGKTIGIASFTWVTVRTGMGVLPRNTTWNHVVGLSALAGIGFTVSLFVTELAFTQEAFADVAKIGIFAGSAVAGVVGSAILLRARAAGSAQDEELLGPDS